MPGRVHCLYCVGFRDEHGLSAVHFASLSTSTGIHVHGKIQGNPQIRQEMGPSRHHGPDTLSRPFPTVTEKIVPGDSSSFHRIPNRLCHNWLPDPSCALRNCPHGDIQRRDTVALRIFREFRLRGFGDSCCCTSNWDGIEVDHNSRN